MLSHTSHRLLLGCTHTHTHTCTCSLEAAGIPCPKPIALRMHVLLMTFIGKDGWYTPPFCSICLTCSVFHACVCCVALNRRGAPRLKDAELSESRLRECYLQCVKLMRVMYHKCKLVHADLSEYNILYCSTPLPPHPTSLDFCSSLGCVVCSYFNKSLYFIDVSQSVEHEHPQALNFLRMDCTNITKFFQNKVTPPLPLPLLLTTNHESLFV